MFRLPLFLCNLFGEQQQREVDFKVHVAVDFGTDGCGLSFAYKDKIYPHTRWGNTKFKHEKKPQNNIVLGANNECIFFGSSAKSNYADCVSVEDIKKWRLFTRFKMSLYQDHIQRFHVDPKHEQKIEIEKTLLSEDGRRCNAEHVFVAAFKKIAQDANKSIAAITNHQNIKSEEIQWIITVPSIWNDNAKNKMIAWATKAGLISYDVRDQCKIVYEPDCASLCLQHLIHDHAQDLHKHIRINPYEVSNVSDVSLTEDEEHKEKAPPYSNPTDEISNPTDDPEHDEEEQKCDPGTDVKNARNYKNAFLEYTYENVDNSKTAQIFVDGDRYMLIDAGGGTLDVVVHEICGQYKVKEILPPSGGKWGSCYVDDQFAVQLEIIFSRAWIDEFKRVEPVAFTQIMTNFQTAKKTFNNDSLSNPDGVHDVELPLVFLDFMTKKIHLQNEENEKNAAKRNMDVNLLQQNPKKLELDAMIKRTHFFSLFIDNDDVHWLRINSIIWSSMFDYALNPAIMHLHKLLETPQLMHGCKYLCLVGGFACSPYFQQRMNAEFGPQSKYRLDIITPTKPILCVVNGAAFFGIHRNFIRSRLLSKTYGVKVNIPLHKAVKTGLSDEFIHTHSYHNAHKNCVFVRNCFHVIARKGDEVMRDTSIWHKIYRPSPKDMTVSLPLLCSDMEHPSSAQDGYVVGQIKVEFFDQKANNMHVVVEFDFSETVLNVFVSEKNNPSSSRKKIELKYLH